jgi:hypothetical protein
MAQHIQPALPSPAVSAATRPFLSANEFRNLPKGVRTAALLQAANRALEMAGYTHRGPAPGLHGGTQCDLYEKDGATYVIAKKASRGPWIAFQPQFDRAGRLQSVRSLDEAHKVCAALIDRRRNLVQVFLFEKEDVRQCFTEHFNARREAGRLPRGGIGMWFCVNRIDDNDRPFTGWRAAGTGLAERYRPIAEFPIEDPSIPRAASQVRAPTPTSGMAPVLLPSRAGGVNYFVVFDLPDYRCYGGTADDVVRQMHANAIFVHDTEPTPELWMAGTLARMGHYTPVPSAEFFLGVLLAAGEIEIYPPGSKIWPRPQS